MSADEPEALKLGIRGGLSAYAGVYLKVVPLFLEEPSDPASAHIQIGKGSGLNPRIASNPLIATLDQTRAMLGPW